MAAQADDAPTGLAGVSPVLREATTLMKGLGDLTPERLAPRPGAPESGLDQWMTLSRISPTLAPAQAAATLRRARRVRRHMDADSSRDAEGAPGVPPGQGLHPKVAATLSRARAWKAVGALFSEIERAPDPHAPAVTGPWPQGAAQSRGAVIKHTHARLWRTTAEAQARRCVVAAVVSAHGRPGVEALLSAREESARESPIAEAPSATLSDRATALAARVGLEDRLESPLRTQAQMRREADAKWRALEATPSVEEFAHAVTDTRQRALSAVGAGDTSRASERRDRSDRDARVTRSALTRMEKELEGKPPVCDAGARYNARLAHMVSGDTAEGLDMRAMKRAYERRLARIRRRDSHEMD